MCQSSSAKTLARNISGMQGRILRDHLITHLGHWGTWGTRLGHLGHSFGALGALVWGTWGTRLGYLRHSSGALEALHQEPMYLMQSSEALGALIFDAPKDNLTHLSEADV